MSHGRRPSIAILAKALLTAPLAILLFGALPGCGEASPRRASAATSASSSVRRDDVPNKESRPGPRSVALEPYLNAGVRAAERLGGHASVAVWLPGESTPIRSDDRRTPARMWSMSKAVVTIAALRLLGTRPERAVQDAMFDAITRSDNCAIRRVILELKAHLGLAGAVRAFDAVLIDAGVPRLHAPISAPAEPACNRYLAAHRGRFQGDILGAAPQFGTDEWTLNDAIAFTHALAVGIYGAAGSWLEELMRRPKQPALEGPPLPELAQTWGAGAVFPARWRPSWKAGWGGSQTRPARFLAGQIVTLSMRRGAVAVAAMFFPTVQPPNDNPGITEAPRALETMFRATRDGLISVVER